MENLIDQALESIQPCNTSNKISVSPLRRKFWNNGRAVKMQSECPHAFYACFESAIAKAGITDDDLSEKLFVAFTKGYQHSSFHPLALEQTAQAVEDFIAYWGDIEAPRWCVVGSREKYPRLYLAIYILGMSGRPFPFAQNAVASAFGFNSGTVRNFILLAVDCNLIEIARHGTPRNPKLLKDRSKNERLGKPNYYRLKSADRFNNFGRTAIRGDKISFAEYLRRNMPWLVSNKTRQRLDD